MSEKRKKIASFCLKSRANTAHKVELFDAEEWPDGPRGSARLRIDGRWKDGPDKARLFLNASGVADVVQRLLIEGGLPAAPCRPQVRKGQIVSVPCAPYDDDGFAWGSEQGRIVSDDVLLGHDGRWYAVISGVTVKTRFFPCEDLGGLEQ